MDEAFADTDFAKRVTANGCPAADYVVHADGAVQLIDTFATKCETLFDGAHLNRGIA